jgi:hypothetical protein
VIRGVMGEADNSIKEKWCETRCHFRAETPEDFTPEDFQKTCRRLTEDLQKTSTYYKRLIEDLYIFQKTYRRLTEDLQKEEKKSKLRASQL